MSLAPSVGFGANAPASTSLPAARNVRSFPIWQRALWRGLRTVGLSRLSWDLQYRAGCWTEERVGPVTLAIVREFGACGRIVEFGCSTGSVPAALGSGEYRDYTGYDISSAAVIAANRRGLPRCTFIAADMADWQGDQNCSLILVRETLYYLTPAAMDRFLERALGSLAPGGRVVVSIHSRTKHPEAVRACERAATTIEDRGAGDWACLVLS